MNTALIVLALLALAVLVAGQIGLLRGQPPAKLGQLDGKLRPPSKTPNSASSQADLWPQHPQQAYARVAPLQALGDATTTMARLRELVQTMPGAQVVRAEGDYLYATFSTRWLKFTDDVEFWFDPAQQAVQVHSASRLGKMDFGANRARVEALRALMQAQAQPVK